MANIMTKSGSQDNILTYEHICDTTADMANIERRYKTLGSTCIVITGESGGIEVYIADQNGEWKAFESAGSGGGIAESSLSIHICTQDEVSNGLPNIAVPEENTIYFVASSEEENNLYTEYVYVNDSWEKMGGVALDLTGYATKAELATVATSGSYDDLSNKPTIPSLSGYATESYVTNAIGNIDLSTKADKNNTVLTGSLSLGRKASTTTGSNSVALGYDVTASGSNAHAEGYNTIASGIQSHAEGSGGTYKRNNISYTSEAAGTADHTEGYMCLTGSGQSGNHAEGYQTQAIGGASHSEGSETIASGLQSHAEGCRTKASGGQAHAEGLETSALNNYAHAEGYNTIASGSTSHAEGASTQATGINSHAEGGGTQATGDYSHAEGNGNQATGSSSHAEGVNAIASGINSHAEGSNTLASGQNSHAEGLGGTYTRNGVTYTSEAKGTTDHVEGYQCLTGTGMPGNHAEGNMTQATGGGAHSEGGSTTASGFVAHAEGQFTVASNSHSHAEGLNSIASGGQSHAEGNTTIASGGVSHAEGYQTIASQSYTHAEGAETQASGIYSHAEGNSTIATGGASHVSGQFNIADSYNNWPTWAASTEYKVGDKVKVTTTVNSESVTKGYICKTAHTSSSTFSTTNWNEDTKMNYAVIVGGGTNTNSRANIYTLDWNGTGHFAGDVYVGCNNDSTGGRRLATEAYAATLVNSIDLSNYVPVSTVTALTARVAELEIQLASLRAALENLSIPADAVLMEDGIPMTDEQGNYLEFDT